jgi:hypothetical protein
MEILGLGWSQQCVSLVDPTRGIAGVLLMQYRFLADANAVVVYGAFERAVYQLPTVSRS